MVLDTLHEDPHILHIISTLGGTIVQSSDSCRIATLGAARIFLSLSLFR